MLLSTQTPVTQIAARAMLDLEDLSGGGLRASYATLVDVLDAGADDVVLLARYEAELITLPLGRDALVPVITYVGQEVPQMSI